MCCIDPLHVADHVLCVLYACHVIWLSCCEGDVYSLVLCFMYLPFVVAMSTRTDARLRDRCRCLKCSEMLRDAQ